jgi:hypothetical protein
LPSGGADIHPDLGRLLLLEQHQTSKIAKLA